MRMIDNNAELMEHTCVPFTDMLLHHNRCSRSDEAGSSNTQGPPK